MRIRRKQEAPAGEREEEEEEEEEIKRRGKLNKKGSKDSSSNSESSSSSSPFVDQLANHNQDDASWKRWKKGDDSKKSYDWKKERFRSKKDSWLGPTGGRTTPAGRAAAKKATNKKSAGALTKSPQKDW